MTKQDFEQGDSVIEVAPEVVEAAKMSLRWHLGSQFIENGLYEETLVALEVARDVLRASRECKFAMT